MSWIGTLAGNELLILVAVGGLILTLLLIVLNFDKAVFICFCLMGLVRYEPAPFDVLIVLLLVTGLLTGKLPLGALRRSASVHLMLWLFLVANLASLAVSASFAASLRFLAITAYLVAFTYFVKLYITSFRAMRLVMLGYLVSAALSTFLVLLGYAGVSPFSTLFLGWGIRAVGAFKDPNVLGPFCVPAILLLLDEMYCPRFLPRFSLIKALGVLLLTAIVFLSFSRGAWANLALALTVYFLFNFNHVLKFKPRDVVTVGVPVVSIGLLGWRSFERLVGKLGLMQFLAWRLSAHGYDRVRFGRQKEGLEAGLTHVFGVGPGTWDHAHSLYVRTLAEHGFLGFAAILGLLGVLATGTLRRVLGQFNRPYGLSATVVLAALAGCALNGLVIDTIHWRHMWLIFGLAWVICTHDGNAGEA